MKQLIVLFSVFFALLLTACGHNVVSYGKGIGFQAGMSEGLATLRLVYGEYVAAATKDHSKITYEGDITESADAAAGVAPTITTGAKLTYETTDQVTGYEVELAEQGVYRSNRKAVKAENEVEK